MNYRDSIENLLKKFLSERAFNLWYGIQSRLPDILELPTSSTGKYHKKMNGEIQSNGEHIYQMLYVAIQIINIFGIELKSKKSDAILLAISLHDSLKYGTNGNRVHTDNQHDKNIADILQYNKQTFLKLFSEEEFNILEEGARFHSGRWSTDVSKNAEFTFRDYNPETMFIHMLDVLSSKDLLKVNERDNDSNNK